MRDFLALDPSSTSTGWAWFERGLPIAFGAIAPPDGLDIHERCCSLVASLDDLCETLDVRCAVVEMPVPFGGGRVDLKYAEACYRIWQYLHGTRRVAHLHRTHVPIWSASYRTGKKAASKRERRAMIAKRVPTYRVAGDGGADVADAIGIGLWWVDKNRLTEAQ